MADAPEIKVKLTAEDTGVAAAIKSLGTQLQELKKTNTDVSSSLSGLKGAFESLVSAAVVYKIVEFGKEVFAASVNIERMSQKTGLSAGLLSTFSKAAETTGVSSDQMNVAVGRLSTNITKFQENGLTGAAAMKALNLTQEDFKNKSADEKIRLVTDRLGAMHGGLLKAATAQELMGRGGQALIPVLTQLAGAGFDEVTKAAQLSGQYLSNEMAQDAAQAAEEFHELEGAAKGIATQFEAGLLPALTDVAEALTNEVQDGGVTAFKKLGEQAGEVAKGIVLFFQTGANLIGAILLSLYDIAKEPIQQLFNGVETLFNAAELSAHGHFKEAGKAIGDGVHKGVDIANNALTDLTSRWTTFTGLVKQDAANLYPTDETKKKRTIPGAAGDGDPEANTDKADKARLSLLESRLKDELAVFKAKNTQEEAANQIAYDEGLVGLQQYFEKRKALARAEADEQISVLERTRAAIKASPTDGTDAGAIEKKQKLEKIEADIAVARTTASTKQAQLDQQLFAAEENHEKTILGYEAEVLAMQGRTYEAELKRIEAESVKPTKGSSPEEAAALEQLQQLKVATAGFNEERKQSEIALKGLTNDRDEIELHATQGLITQVGAEQRIEQVEIARLPLLRQIADAMKKAAVSPEQKQEAADFARNIDQIAASTNRAGKEMAQFKNQAVSAIGGDLSTFLGSTIDHVHGVGDAFRQLAGSVVASIQQIVAQLIVQIAMEKILKSIEKSDGSDGGGGGGGGGSGILGALLGFAEGGFVSGPGSGTSDSIPARLSAGEFVMTAAATDAIGVNTLHMLNRSSRSPSISGMSIPRFAEGGLVKGAGGGNGGPMDLRVGIGLDEGIILKHLGSKQAGKIVIQHLGDNPKAASKAISRGQ